MGRWTGKSCRLSTMMVMTASFFLVEIVVGYVTNSIALVADSFHMLSDLAALIVGLASVKIAKKTSKGNTYGWRRAEVLGALVNCVFLLAMCFFILVESLKRLVELEPIENPLMMLIVGGLGLLVNLLGLLLFGGHGHAHGGSSHGHTHGHGHAHTHDVMEKGHGHPHSNGHDAKLKDEYESLHLCNNKATSNGHHHHESHHHQNRHQNHHTNGDCVETKRLVDPDEYVMITPPTTPTIVTELELECPIDKQMNGVLHDNSNGHVFNGHIISNGHVGNGHVSNGLCASRETTGDCSNEKDVTIQVEKPAVSPSSMNMRGVFLHVLGDALGSVVVILSGLAIWLLEEDWKYYLDPVLSVSIVGIILYTTIPLFKETAHILLQAVPQGVCVDTITKELMEIEGVTGVSECHVWQLSGHTFIASAHVRCQDLRDYFRVESRIKDVFARAGIHSTTVQPEIEKSCVDSASPIHSIENHPRTEDRNVCADTTSTCSAGKSPIT